MSALTENQRRLLYIIGSYTKPTLADEVRPSFGHGADRASAAQAAACKLAYHHDQWPVPPPRPPPSLPQRTATATATAAATATAS